MNSAVVSAYSSHSYYNASDALSAANHAAASAASAASAATANWSQSHVLPNVFTDYYNGSVAVPEYYPTYSSVPNRYTGSSTGTPSPRSFDNPNYWSTSTDQLYSQLAGNVAAYGPYGPHAGKKKGVTNSKKERRRTISINGAFSNLRDCIPNVPKDTKLSKIKTLRLACGYIQHLSDALDSDTGIPLQEFKADLSRKTPCRAEKRKCIEAEIAAAADRKSRGRSGWPQTIWAQDLKGEPSSVSSYSPIKSSLIAQPQAISQEANSNNLNSTTTRIEHMDSILHPSPSCTSSLCEESSSTSDIAGSLG